jgi:hypothetical protein
VENRAAAIPGLRLPSWQDVVERDFTAWTTERIVIDTANRREQESIAELLSKLQEP